MYDFSSYKKACDLADAIRLLKANPQARLIAGGTDVLIKLHKGKPDFAHLVDIHELGELKNIELDSDRGIIIGSGVHFSTLVNSDTVLKQIPMLAEASGSVGGPQVRNMATIGGNICNGIPSADGAIPLFCFNTILMISGPDGTRELPIEKFYLGPGKVDLKPAEVLKSFIITENNYRGMLGHYCKYAMRESMDIATIGCATLCKIEDRRIKDLRIAFGVAGPVPLRCKKTESFAKGRKISGKLFQQISEKVADDLKPRDSWRASKAFRLQIIKALAYQGMVQTVRRAGEKIE